MSTGPQRKRSQKAGSAGVLTSERERAEKERERTEKEREQAARIELERRVSELEAKLRT